MQWEDKRIFFDLDGVLRNLHKIVWGFEPLEYDSRINGKTLIDIVDNDLQILERAEPTELVPIVQKMTEVKIITNQPPHWRPYTMRWLNKYFFNNSLGIMYADVDGKKEFIRRYEDVILIDDHPELAGIERVITYDRMYNRDKVAWIRLRKPQELYKILEGI